MAVPPPTTDSQTAAKDFLKALGAPTSAVMIRAVQAWLRAEGSTIIGNNPWNLHSGTPCHSASGYCPGNGNLPGQIGNRYAGKGDQNVAVFSSLNAGAKASAVNLTSHGNDWTGYGRVVDAARAGDPIAFLNALARSAWSGGRYKINPGAPPGGTNNKLIAYYSGTSRQYDSNPAPVPKPAPGGTGTTGGTGGTNAAPAKDLGAWGDQITYPVGHVLTAQDVQDIVDTLDKNGWFKDDPTGTAKALVRGILTMHIGEQWNKSLQDRLSQQFGQASVLSGRAFDPTQGAASSLIGFLGTLTDPGHWAFYLAIVGGSVLTLVGGYFVLKATTGVSVPMPFPRA
jgi:hypothetical protein